MSKTIIHVNQHVIKANRKNGTTEPVLTAKYRGKAHYSSTAVIVHEGVEVARIVYRPDKPLSCGAHVWIETGCPVLYDEQCDGVTETTSSQGGQISISGTEGD